MHELKGVLHIKNCLPASLSVEGVNSPEPEPPRNAISVPSGAEQGGDPE